MERERRRAGQRRRRAARGIRVPLRALGVFGVLGVLAVSTVACSSAGSTGTVASLPGRGGDTQSGGPLTQAKGDQDMVDFTRCLRDNGVPEPDPVHRPGHAGLSVEVPTPGPGTSAALAACSHFLAPIAQMKQSHARQELAAWLPALTRYAQCMRAHDISMLDPDTQGTLNLGNVPGISNDFGRYSPQFRSADSACRRLLPAAVRDDGTGP